MTRPGSASLLGLLLTLMLVATAAPATAATPEGRRREPLPLRERIQTGAYVQDMQADPERLTAYERMLGTRVGIASYYYGFGDVFPARPELTFSDQGRRKVLLSWDMGPTRFAEWSSGQHDGYLDQIAAAARAYPYRVYVRPWPEMNGDWQAFQPTAKGERPYGGTYAEFKAAWRHVVSYLRDQGADNISWVFNPTADTYAQTTPVRRIWPGAGYVDVLGLDGFNWGRDSGYGRWKSFSRIFKRQYARLTHLARRAPVWICEVASKEPARDDGAPVDSGHDKATWVRGLFQYRGMPRLKAVVWFQADKERDWRLNSSPTSLAAARRMLQP